MLSRYGIHRRMRANVTTMPVQKANEKETVRVQVRRKIMARLLIHYVYQVTSVLSRSVQLDFATPTLLYGKPVIYSLG
jgi:hypothetical protein